MQLYALDGDSPLVAGEAKRQKNYRCPECLAPVRLRLGPERQAHFYHLSSSNCSQHKKSLPHLQAQLYLQKLLPNCSIEKPFPSIGRIADVFWEKEKIVFEIQCSPMPLKEAQERCRDYARAGVELVWVLHEKNFNKRKLTASEHFLRGRACYFTNMDEKGRGIFYDQFDIAPSIRRLFRGPPLAINPLQPLRPSPEKLHFEGDLLDRTSKATPEQLLHMEAVQKRFLIQTEPFSLRGFLKKSYLILFRFLLEGVAH